MTGGRKDAKAAKKAFLTDVQLACRPAAEPGEVTGSETSNSAPRGMLDAQAVQLQMQTAMLKCIGKNVKEVVKVDMCDRMKALGLFDLFPNTVRAARSHLVCMLEGDLLNPWHRLGSICSFQYNQIDCY